jgi:histidine triad (HIT) family protein
VEKEIGASIIYEDEEVLAFLDVKPLNIGHTLVISKKHFENIYDIPEDTISHLQKVVKKLAISVKKAMEADGITIIQNNETAGSQAIFHFHTHILPRYVGDKLNIVNSVWETNVLAGKEELEAAKEKIKNLSN